MFPKHIFKKIYPRLDWIQIEISSICNAECIYCPHTEYSNNWENRLFPIGLYKKLIPAFGKTKLVFLQGWGEPFTHPDFMEFLRIAKKEGCMVGTTTNGMLLDSEKIGELVDEGLDIIGFSLAGLDKKNDEIRKGTQISKVLKCIEEIQRIKEVKGAENPRVHIAYMLLKSGLDDIPNLAAFLENTGVHQTVVSSLSLAVNESMNKETLSVKEGREILETAFEPASTEIAFSIVSPLMEESRCPENIERAVVIGADGSVSPCVMGTIPAAGENYYYFRGERMRLENMGFGNISNEPLNSIWHKKKYRDFIRSHRRNDFNSLCKSCSKRFIINFQ